MSFDRVAAAYDLLSSPAARLAREGALLKTLAPPESRVLDLACGVGMHAEYLARWGASVVAVDASECMIEHARMQHQHPRVTYQLGDLKTPPAGPFDCILCLGNSLNCLASHEQVQAALVAMHAQLADGGTLLLQCINPESAAHAQPRLVHKEGEVEGRQLHVVKSMVPLSTGRLLTLTTLERDPRQSPSPEVMALLLLDLTQPELSASLAKAGFSAQRWFGDMQNSPFVREGSPDMVVLASK